MKIDIVEIPEIRTFIGIRVTDYFSNLGAGINSAFIELQNRKAEIRNIRDLNVTYSITPPNYKGNTREVDYYCCFEVNPIVNLPHGMVHIHILPRTYSRTHYIGPLNKSESAYDYTSKWMIENGYAYDDVDYYFERYDEKTTVDDHCNDNNEMMVYCPIKKFM